MNQINFGENVRTIRFFKDYSQDYVTSRISISQATYSRIENSPEIPDVEILNEIAAVLEVSVAELLVAEVVLDKPAKYKARIGIYTIVTYLVAIAVGIICMDPAWQYVNHLFEIQGASEGWRVFARMVGAFVPMAICLWLARKVTKRYKAAYGVD